MQGLTWGHNVRGLVGVWTESSVSVLSETELNRKSVGNVAAVQISNNDVVVQQTSGLQHTVRSSIPVRVRVVCYCIVSYRIVLYRIVSYRIVSYRIVSYRIVSYRIVA